MEGKNERHDILGLRKPGSTTEIVLTGDDDERDDHDLDPQGVSVRADPEHEQTQCQCTRRESQHPDRLARRVPIYKQIRKQYSKKPLGSAV